MKRNLKQPYKSKGKPRPPFSQEWKDNISKSRMGFKVSEETKNKMSLSKKGKKFTLEHRKKLGLKGEKNPMWRGGVSSLHQQIRNTFEYRQWRSDVFSRDNFTCQICNDKNYEGRGGSLVLHADHMKTLTFIMRENLIDSVEKAILCNELWNINNGRTLCAKCHGETPTYGVKVKRYV